MLATRDVVNGGGGSGAVHHSDGQSLALLDLPLHTFEGEDYVMKEGKRYKIQILNTIPFIPKNISNIVLCGHQFKLTSHSSSPQQSQQSTSQSKQSNPQSQASLAPHTQPTHPSPPPHYKPPYPLQSPTIPK